MKQKAVKLMDIEGVVIVEWIPGENKIRIEIHQQSSGRFREMFVPLDAVTSERLNKAIEVLTSQRITLTPLDLPKEARDKFFTATSTNPTVN